MTGTRRRAAVGKLDTQGVHLAIAKRYESARGNGDSPRYVVAHEVRDATGFGHSRTADVLVLKCWPSDGIGLIGFEVKVDRGDWLRELRAPAKAEAFAPHCQEWWIAAGSADVVLLDELPPGWGLMVPTPAGELRSVRAAHVQTPPPPPWELVASIVRSATGQTVERQVRVAVERQLGQATRAAENNARHLERCHQELQARIKSFEERSGIKLDSWQDEKIADAVRLLMELGPSDDRHGIAGRLKLAALQMRQLSESTTRAAEEFAAILAPSPAPAPTDRAGSIG